MAGRFTPTGSGPANRSTEVSVDRARPSQGLNPQFMDRLRVLAEAQGYFTRPDALTSGHDDNSIRRALKSRLWVRIRHGVYTFDDLHTVTDEVSWHRNAARALARKLGNRVALSHASAAIEHGLLVHGLDLSLLHVTRLDGAAGRTDAGVVHHEGFCTDDDIMEIDGLLVVKPVRAALETASLGSSESAVVVLDSALHNGVDRAELESTYDVLSHWPHMRRLQVPVRLADGRAESVGESLTRRLCWVQGIPVPELQFEVRDAGGALIGTTDFAWPGDRLLGEFDGKVKYGRLLRPGETPADAVFREKVREDRLREALQWGMVRLVWADLHQPATTAAQIQRLLRRVA